MNAPEQLQEEPHRFTLFAALRLLEQMYPDRPRLGESARADQDAVRLTQPPYLHFAPSEVVQFVAGDAGASTLEQYNFGLLGPNGPLPLHLTEFCFERLKHHDDPSLSAFLNLLHHRLISLFYRAWANSDPATSFDRPQADRFGRQFAALVGIGMPGAEGRDGIPDLAKRFFTGRVAPVSRSADGLAACLTGYFCVPVAIRSFVGEWLQIPPDAVTRIGLPSGCAELGVNTTLGASSWQCQQRFEVVVGPLPIERYLEFLPDGDTIYALRDLVRFYTNDEWAWHVRLDLRLVDVPHVQLGQSGRLGWTTWLGRRVQLADDLVIHGDDLQFRRARQKIGGETVHE